MTKLEICNEKVKESLDAADKAYRLNYEMKEYIIEALCEIITETGHYCYVEQPENKIYYDDEKEDERIERENKKLDDYIENNKDKLKGKFLFLFENYPKNTDEYDDYRSVINIFLLGKTYKVEVKEKEINYSFDTRNYLEIFIRFDQSQNYESDDKETYYYFDMRLHETNLKHKFDKTFENLDDFIQSFKLTIEEFITKHDDITPFD